MSSETLYCSCGQDFDKLPMLEIHKQKCPTIKDIRKKEEDQNHDIKENKPPIQVGQLKCDKVCRTFKDLWKPNLRHECFHCGKKFSSPSKLQHHQLIHTGENPFSCKICRKGFNQLIHLQKDPKPLGSRKRIITLLLLWPRF